ncbi:MAG: hypothetical protein LBI05_05600 [Planctomycetaceae bacterium]|jgi:hypothetical protein|nr:hypothetical protein [Planctomycetaceae bacterium]
MLIRSPDWVGLDSESDVIQYPDMAVESKSSQRESKPKQQGNYIDAFVKKMFGRVVVFADFLLNVRLMYSRQDQWREDALLIMFE